LTALITGLSHAYYALDVDKGLPAQLSQLFPGMSLKNGVFDPGRPTPYVPPAPYVSKALNTIACMPGFADNLPDSSLIIDTASKPPAWESASAGIVLTRQSVEVKLWSGMDIRMPYSWMLPPGTDLEFTREGVHSFLNHNLIWAVKRFCFQSGRITAFGFFFSSIFLTLAAFIFNNKENRKLGRCVKQACFAMTPSAAGASLIALSGAQLSIGPVLFFISLAVLMRGTRAGGKAGAGG
jgi:hypothetical protein